MVKRTDHAFIEKVSISNFKSFRKQEIEFKKFNVIIGPNAAGKSNLVQLFRFIKDMATNSLDNAINMQGGVEYFRNVNIGNKENFSIKIHLSEVNESRLSAFGIIIKDCQMEYGFDLKFKSKGSGFTVLNDSVVFKGRFERSNPSKKGRNIRLGEGRLGITSKDDKMNYDLVGNFKDKEVLIKSIKEKVKKEMSYFRTSLRSERKLEHGLLLNSFFYNFIAFDFYLALSQIAIYDIDPKLPKSLTAVSDDLELDEDGKNLPIILSNILNDKKKRDKLINLAGYLLPTLKDLKIDVFLNKYISLEAKEINTKNSFHSYLLSDGTINIISLLIILYFGRKGLTIIEEPEKNLHPFLIKRVVAMLKEASTDRQIIITTHSPQVVKYSGVENLFLINRDKEGYSEVTCPGIKNKELISSFMKNHLGIEDIYTENLFEAE